MPPRRSIRTRNSLTTTSSPPTSAASARPRRTASGVDKQVTIAREDSESPEGAKKAIHLKVKMPSNKLREATSGGRKGAPDGLETADMITGPRAKRSTKRSYVVESESDEAEDEEEEAEEEVPIEDQIGEPEVTDEDEDAAADEEDEEDEPDQDIAADEDEAESAEADEDEDEEMEDASPMPPPPVVTKKGPPSKPSLKVTPAQTGKLKSVEAKEMEMEEEDEDLSSIESGEEDAEGEDLDEGDEMDQDDDREIESAGVGSRGSTPDLSKMTKRQKSRLSEVMGNDFLQLPMGESIQFFYFVAFSSASKAFSPCRQRFPRLT